jgi:hypothetical protein
VRDYLKIITWTNNSYFWRIRNTYMLFLYIICLWQIFVTWVPKKKVGIHQGDFFFVKRRPKLKIFLRGGGGGGGAGRQRREGVKRQI